MLLKLMILYLLVLGVVKCEKETFFIVGLFEDSDLEETFRYAIEEVNSDPKAYFTFNLLPVQHFPDDAFAVLNSTCNSIRSKAPVAIFGPSSPSSVNVVKAICDAKDIPHILTRWVDSQQETNMEFNFFPDRRLTMDAWSDIISHLKWEDVTILYVNPEDLAGLGYFIEKAYNAGISIGIEQLESSDARSYRPALGKLRDSGKLNYILYCEIDELQEILLQMQQLGMLTENYNYFLTNLDSATLPLQQFSYGKAKIVGIQLQNLQHDVANNEAVLKTELALIADAISMLSNTLKNFKVTQNSTLDCYNSSQWMYGQSIVNVMKMDTPFIGLTGQIAFDDKGQRNSLELHIFELREDGIVTVGVWNESYRLNVASTIEFDDEEKTLVVITTLTEPFAMLKQSSEELTGNDRLEGFAIDLIEELSLMCGFDYRLTIRTDNRIGNPNSVRLTWDGMIGDVLNNVADLAIGDITITSEREEVVDFTPPFMTFGVSILYQKALPSASGGFLFTDPFTLEVWICILVTGILVSILLCFLGRISSSEWKNPNCHNKKPEYLVTELTLMNCLWFVTGSFMRQCYDIKLKSVPTRTVAAMWWFFTLVIVSLYVAQLVLIFSHPSSSTESHFSNLEELVTRAPEKQIKFGAKLGGATASFFKGMAEDNDVYAKAWDYMQNHEEDVMVKTNAEGVRKALQERYALFMESSALEYAVERNCELQQINGLLNERGYGIAMRKNSTYRNSISKTMLKLQFSGKIDALKRKWWHETRGGGQCSTSVEDDEAEPSPLYFDRLWSIFWVTIFGTIAAFLLAILEAIIDTVKRANEAKIPLRTALRRDLAIYFSRKMIKPVSHRQRFEAISEERELNAM